ncbi:MAG TPA: vanadium-dependent haloperoxidase [Candidatus Limnocylindria bacterium]
MKLRLRLATGIVFLAATTVAVPGSTFAASPATQCRPAAAFPAATTPVSFWSTEARCAIVPAGPNGIFGLENFGSKFPGEAAVYMGIVHVAIYDAVVAFRGGYEPYAPVPVAPPGASLAAGIATAAYDTLSGLQPQLAADQTIIDGDYTAYLAGLSDGPAAISAGNAIGHAAAAAVLALRGDDGRGCSTTLTDLGLPAPAPGVWQPGPGPALGLCLPGIRPLALLTGSQFRPDGPNALAGEAYADDFNQVRQLGSVDSSRRTPDQTSEARFWTDHDLRQWNDGMLALADSHGLDLLQTARMLAMAHVAGGDAMIACFDAKYHFWFWRPIQAIRQADADGNPRTLADAAWTPLATTPNFPEYPSAHACHSTAVVEALDAFFGTDKVAFTLTSRAPLVTQRTRAYARLHDVVKDVDWARVLVGFHFRNSDLQGTSLGRKVARFVVDHDFLPVD